MTRILLTHDLGPPRIAATSVTAAVGRTRWRSAELLSARGPRCHDFRPTRTRAVWAAAAPAARSQPAEKVKLDSFLGQVLIQGPSRACQADDATQTLLVLLPGALTPADHYQDLAVALRDAVKDHMCLVVAIVDVSWDMVKQSDPGVTTTRFVKLAVEKAVSAAADHMHIKKSSTGRHENMFLAGHSLMGVAAVRYGLDKAAGLVLLGSAMAPKTSDLFPTALTWTRPMLQVSAELDGQQCLTRQAFSVLGAAEAAANLGLRHAATHQPAIVLPGLNHASFAGGVAQSSDLQPDVNHAEGVKQVAEVMANFLIAHCSDEEAKVDAAVKALVEWQLESAHIVDPYLTALGRGSPVQAFGELRAEPHQPSRQALLRAGVIPGSFGGEVLMEDETSRKWLAHPGELEAAVAFTAKVQQEAVPKTLRSRVVVAVTAHTDEFAFLVGQPTIHTLPGGRVLVHAHVHLWRQTLQPSKRAKERASASFQHAVAPEYALKLRSTAAICRALGEDAAAGQPAIVPISGQTINEATFEEALTSVTEEVRQRYLARGKQFCFGEDVAERQTQNWVQRCRVSYQDIEDSEQKPRVNTRITSPVHMWPPDGKPISEHIVDFAHGMGRFEGSHYLKVVSLARAMEWLMIDALRPADLETS